MAKSSTALNIDGDFPPIAGYISAKSRNETSNK